MLGAREVRTPFLVLWAGCKDSSCCDVSQMLGLSRKGALWSQGREGGGKGGRWR